MDFPKRKKIRLKGYDYSQNGVYFVTVCAKDRMNLFGQIIVGATAPGRPSVSLSALGECIDETIKNVNVTAENDAKIDAYVVMPNHMHLIVTICSNAGDRGRSPLPIVVRNIKSYVSKWAGFSPWQKTFHDHIIRDEQDYQKIWQYIETNPLVWEEDCFYCN